MKTMDDLSIKKLGSVRRKVRKAAPTELVKTGSLPSGQSLPVLIEPAVDGVDLAAWARDHREVVEGHLDRVGGVLFRGFDLGSIDAFQAVIRALYGELLTYTDRVQPRDQVAAKVYTSTLYPPDQSIEMHNEAAYSYSWPLRILFYCAQPSPVGGETPIADCRRVLEGISDEVLRRFEEQGVMYVRNFGDGFGITWQSAFQTEDREEMEEFCRRTGVELEWKGDGRLRTRSVRPVVLRHPRTGERLWFNAAVSSHISTVAPAVREALLAEFRQEELPKNSFYGDGSPIEAEVLEELRRAYREETVDFPWQRGDVLLLDNMLVSHSRRPYSGDRKVVVGMAEGVELGDFAAASGRS